MSTLQHEADVFSFIGVFLISTVLQMLSVDGRPKETERKLFQMNTVFGEIADLSTNVNRSGGLPPTKHCMPERPQQR